jgi:hypothetical protein
MRDILLAARNVATVGHRRPLAYCAGRVDRRILELTAQIDRVDRCGPLVLGDGTVGGVVVNRARGSDHLGPRDATSGFRRLRDLDARLLPSSGATNPGAASRVSLEATASAADRCRSSVRPG